MIDHTTTPDTKLPGGVRIISGPVEVDIDGRRYAWTPRMEAAIRDYTSRINGAKARLADAERECRAAIDRAVKDLIASTKAMGARE